jgi:hypothetical protein
MQQQGVPDTGVSKGGVQKGPSRPASLLSDTERKGSQKFHDWLSRGKCGGCGEDYSKSHNVGNCPHMDDAVDAYMKYRERKGITYH